MSDAAYALGAAITPEAEDVALPDLDRRACDWLRAEVETLAQGRTMWSRGALTQRCTQHKQFLNGLEYPEWRGHDATYLPGPYKGEPHDLAVKTLEVIRRYRQSVDGPADLVWRIEPEITRTNEGISLYTRLCFEPTLTQVATGIWWESHLVG